MYKTKKIKGLLLFLVLMLSMTLISCDSNSNKADDAKKDVEITDNETKVTEENIFGISPFTDETLNYYSIEASLNTENSVISATQSITYTNTENTVLEEVYLHLYPNAFNKENHPSLFDASKNEIDDQNGYVDVISVEVNGESVNFGLDEIDTVLRVEYDKTFLKGETYEITLTYDVGIASTSERFGVANGLYNLGNWYPILAVYDEDGWNLDPYYNIGDPFYSDVSNYDVTFEVPKDFVVSASGYAADILYEDDKKTYNFRGDRIRDFALALSDRFNIISKTINDTAVYVYYPDELSDNQFIPESLDFAVNAIELYSYAIGEYPYKTYSVVITNFPSGMEYPGLVFISQKYYIDNVARIKGVIVHETAHQWFYGIVGDDEIDEGWIDEGLTTYMTAFYDMKYVSEVAYKAHIASYESRLSSAGGKDNVVMIKSVKDYSDWGEYGLAAYTKSMLMFSELYDTYGEDKFIEFTQALYNEYKFGVLKQEGLVRVAKSIFDGNLDDFFESWLK